MNKIIVFLTILVASLYASDAAKKEIVTTSILPTKYFVEQIAGDTVDVNTMVSPGSDPHTYEPHPEQMKNLERSDIFFAVGMEYEDVWLPKFSKSYPNLDIVATQNGVPMLISHHDHDHHDHDHHHHDHGEFDPHIWLDPVIVKIQAKNIAQALIKHYPQNKALYESNLAKFDKVLDELDLYIKNELKDVKNRNFIVYHPSWAYFAKRYGLDQIPIETEGKEPKPAQLAELIKQARVNHVKVIFVAPEFSKKSAELIAKESGAKVMQIDHLSQDWLNNMRKSAEIFKQNL